MIDLRDIDATVIVAGIVMTVAWIGVGIVIGHWLWGG